MELYFLIFPPDTLLIDYFILPYCKRNIEVMTMRNYVNVSDNQKYCTFCHVKTAQSTVRDQIATYMRPLCPLPGQKYRKFSQIK